MWYTINAVPFLPYRAKLKRILINDIMKARHPLPLSPPHEQPQEEEHTERIKRRKETTHQSFISFVSTTQQLCTLPFLITVVVASLDSADKSLLASSFAILEKLYGFSVQQLGYFSLATNLSYAVSLPFWSFLVHRYGMVHIHTILSFACVSWGLSTLGVGVFASDIVTQAIFRALNGFALGSILPLSQTLLVEMVTPDMRGRAFGWLGLCEKLAGTMAAASVVIYDSHWQRSYLVLGLLSMVMARVVQRELTSEKRAAANRMKSANQDDVSTSKKLTIRQIVTRIVRIPAFVCLVMQGIFGGTPWDMMSFLLLLMDWRQFTKSQIVTLQFGTGLASTIGGWVGGVLGDHAATLYDDTSKGRIVVALVSVIGGIPLYGLYLFSTHYHQAFLYSVLFHAVASWTPAAALRPICADLARNPSERAQVMSLWIVLEKTSGALFGAPLVGYLTDHMMKTHDRLNDMNPDQKANTLAWNLFGLSAFFWVICAIFWVGMFVTIGDTTKDLSTQPRGNEKRDFEPLV